MNKIKLKDFITNKITYYKDIIISLLEEEDDDVEKYREVLKVLKEIDSICKERNKY